MALLSVKETLKYDKGTTEIIKVESYWDTSPKQFTKLFPSGETSICLGMTQVKIQSNFGVE